MTIQEAQDQARLEFEEQVKQRAAEIMRSQLAVMENDIAAMQDVLTAKRAELEALQNQLAQG